MTQKVSTEVQTESTRIANGIKKPGQSREQTKLIAAGIEKGIAEYKKQHKAKARQLDKQKKQKIRSNTAAAAKENEAEIEIEQTQSYCTISFKIAGIGLPGRMISIICGVA